MDMKPISTRLYWAGHILRYSPGLFLHAVRSAVSARLGRRDKGPRICIGTHHKVLTVLLARVFRSFAVITGRSYSYGTGAQLDDTADVLIDHHSAFNWSQIDDPVVGLHVTRDPRDLLVSAAFYHMKGSEAWLHEPRADLEGKSYYEHVNELEGIEQRMLFEIDNSGGNNVRQMLEWVPHPGISETRYDKLVGEGAIEAFTAIVDTWQMPDHERRLLVDLFRYFSLGGAGAKSTDHIRNASSGQWREHFTPAVTQRFGDVFPDALDRLGYEATEGEPGRG